MYSFETFHTPQQAVERMNDVLKVLPDLWSNHLNDAKTLKILHDEPEVWRIWWQLGGVRVGIHTLWECAEDCYLHNHPWRSIVFNIAGGYQHTIANYSGPVEDIMRLTPDKIEEFTSQLVTTQMSVSPGDYYVQTDLRQFHRVSVRRRATSIMLMTEPFFKGATTQFSRKQPLNNPQLTREEIKTVEPVFLGGIANHPKILI